MSAEDCDWEMNKARDLSITLNKILTQKEIIKI